MTILGYWIATREGYLPKLIESEQIAKDLARGGWDVVRVAAVEPLREAPHDPDA